MIKAAIFDVDGTLLDSMPIWMDAGARYLRNIGIQPEENLPNVLWNMSIPEGVAYVKDHYKVPFTEKEITEGILATVRDFYYYEAPLKPGVLSFLTQMKEKQIPMVIATSSDRSYLDAAFKRTGIDGFFEKIFTCEEVGAGKTSPRIYEVAREYLGTKASETYVFEDVIHAVESAKSAGFKVIGLYDEASEKHTDLIKEKCDLYLKDFTECEKFWEKIRMKTALTIAGSDSSGGAGIQADIKTMMANGVYAMSAITALTAQNTLGVTAIFETTPEFLGEQIDNIFTDIRPDAVKIGMVSSKGLIHMIADKLKEYHAENIVVDPVMVATSGAKLISDDAIDALKEELFPLASVLTPNIPEAEILSGMSISTEEEMVEAARIISEQYHCACLLKGGHKINDANDLLCHDGKGQWFYGKRINNSNTHGTGCTLSSAIASNLAKGFDLAESVRRAKEYISGALSAMLDLGKGSGPMNHGFDIAGTFAKYF